MNRPLSSVCSLAPLGMVAFLALGCDVPLLNEVAASSTQNSCDSSSDCGGGRCVDGICQATESPLDSLLLEVTPATGSAPISGVTFTHVLDVSEGDVEIKLGHVSRINGRVHGAELSNDTCVIDSKLELDTLPEQSLDGSLPARMTLTPRERLLGLTNQPVTSFVGDPSLDPGATSPAYSLAFSVPPGRYDIYVQPAPTRDGCARPPYLVIDRQIEAGDVNLAVDLPVPERLTVAVRYPRAIDDLGAWTLDMVDRDSGKALSNRPMLGDPTSTDEGLEYSVELAFNSVEGEDRNQASELVRLAPPEGVVAPTIYVERSVVDLFQDGAGLIDQLTELPLPVTFEGRMALQDSTIAAPGKVTFIATELSQTTSGALASFSRTVETGEDGTFQTELLPGKYSMFAEPFDSNLSMAQSGIAVTNSSESQVGKTIEVTPRNRVFGQVQSFAGGPIEGAPIWATAAAESRSVIQLALGEFSSLPSATSSVTAADGAFELLADTGIFQVAARPDSTSGFAWRVLLDVDVSGGSTNLGTVRLSLPVAVNKTLTSSDTGTFVPNALIRMFAFLSAGELVQSMEEADAVVAIGEARSDDSGRLRLLLPSSF